MGIDQARASAPIGDTPAAASSRRHFLEPLVLAWKNRRVSGIFGIALIGQRRSHGGNADFAIAAVETFVLAPRSAGRVFVIHHQLRAFFCVFLGRRRRPKLLREWGRNTREIVSYRDNRAGTRSSRSTDTDDGKAGVKVWRLI